MTIRLVCNSCDQWVFYLQFLPHNLYHTIANVKKRKKIVGMSAFNFCGWCGAKLSLERVRPSRWDLFKNKWRKK